MEIAGLTLAIPPTIVGILKCIKLFNEIHGKLGGASDKLQRVLVKCRMLEMALEQLAAMGTTQSGDPLTLTAANCAKVIKSMEHLLRKLGVDPDDASTLHDIKVIDLIWKDAEVKSLTNLLDECRDDVAFYLMVQMHSSQISDKAQLATQQKTAARQSSILQSDNDTLRFSFLTNDSKFSTTALNINPERSSLASVQFSFDQIIQSSRVYQKFAHAALPSLPPESRIPNDHQQTLPQELPDDVNKKDENMVAASLPDSVSDHYGSSILDEADNSRASSPLLRSPGLSVTSDQDSDEISVHDVLQPLGEDKEPTDLVPEQKEAMPKTTDEPAIPNALYVRAIYSYEAHNLRGLSFREGDVIKVITQLESGWWNGILHQVRGWFPSNYTRIISSADAKGAAKPYEAISDDIVEEDEVSDALEDFDEHQPAAAWWVPQATRTGILFYYNLRTGESTLDLVSGGYRPIKGEMDNTNSHGDALKSDLGTANEMAPSSRYMKGPSWSTLDGTDLSKNSKMVSVLGPLQQQNVSTHYDTSTRYRPAGLKSYFRSGRSPSSRPLNEPRFSPKATPSMREEYTKNNLRHVGIL